MTRLYTSGGVININVPVRNTWKSRRFLRRLDILKEEHYIPGHPPFDRPRTTWMRQIVRDTGLTAADAWALADDWSTWRALRPTAGYAQQ